LSAQRLSARRFGARLLSMQASVLIVMAACTVTSLLALQNVVNKADERRTIDKRLMVAERLRADALEIARSARRFVLGGNLQERQRVQAISAEMETARRTFRGLRLRPDGISLDTSLDVYLAAIDEAMDAEGEPVERLAQFEATLLDARNLVSTDFDRFVAGERARRETLRSAFVLAGTARWAILVGSVLVVLMVFMSSVMTFRRVQRDELLLQTRGLRVDGPPVAVAASEPSMLV